jgi:RNA polymerase sigma-70 factor, ECF subfamily
MDKEELATIREFYEEHSQALFTYALALTRCQSTAEDVVHEAVCRLLKRSALPEELRPYAFRCVRNAAVDARRRERPTEPLGILDFSDGRTESSFDRTLCFEMEKLLLDLPLDEMESVVLRIYDGLTFREIGDVKGASPNTVASWFRRGVAKLRKRVTGDV